MCLGDSSRMQTAAIWHSFRSPGPEHPRKSQTSGGDPQHEPIAIETTDFQARSIIIFHKPEKQYLYNVNAWGGCFFSMSADHMKFPMFQCFRFHLAATTTKSHLHGRWRRSSRGRRRARSWVQLLMPLPTELKQFPVAIVLTVLTFPVERLKSAPVLLCGTLSTPTEDEVTCSVKNIQPLYKLQDSV